MFFCKFIIIYILLLFFDKSHLIFFVNFLLFKYFLLKKVIDEDNNLLKSDIICDNETEPPSCILYFVLTMKQLAFKSFKLIPHALDLDAEVTQQSVFKGFTLKFSKLVSISVDNDFTKFEYKVCKPRDKESYTQPKNFRLELNEFIQTSQDQDEGNNITDEDKEIHICLTERFSIDYREFVSKKCGKNNTKCSTKYDFAPNHENLKEIVNASIYIGHEVFELKV